MKDKLAICYTCCGPTYRKTAKEKLMDLYVDDEDIFYFVITDNKEYFKDVDRKNLFVFELKEFYDEYPHIEKYEYFLESDDPDEYGKEFLKQKYKFPFAVNRFHLLIAHKMNIKNVAMLCTDTDIILDSFDSLELGKNYIYNAMTIWDVEHKNHKSEHVVEILKNDYGYEVNDRIRVFDAAAKLFTFSDTEYMYKFFKLWDETMFKLYDSGKIRIYRGSYAINSESILAPIYDVMNIQEGYSKTNLKFWRRLFKVKHNKKEERFWMQ